MDAEQRFDSLPLLEQTVLWSMRCWAIGCRSQIDVMPRITSLFTELRVPEAATHLDALMGALSQGAVRMLDVQCVCHSHVSPDEELLLDAAALHQEQRREDARVVLETLITPEAAAGANLSAERLATALNRRGHHFPRGSDALRRHAFASPLRRATLAVSTLLH